MKKFLTLNNLRNYIVLSSIFILLALILAIFTPQYFNYSFFYELFRRFGEYMIVAIGLTIVFISHEYDVSFGSIVALSGVVCGKIYLMGYAFPIAIISAILVGIIFGLIHAVFVVNFKLNSFIVTLATMQIGRSLVYVVGGSKTVVGFPKGFQNLADITVLKIPIIFVIAVFILLLSYLLMNKSFIGRYIYAIGGNSRAALISGINVNRIKYFVFILSGFLASISGLIVAARLKSVPPATGQSMMLEVLTAVLLGGTMITGGVGNIGGSMLGVVVMLFFINIFSINAINPFWTQVLLGLSIILIVGSSGIRTYFITLYNDISKKRIKNNL